MRTSLAEKKAGRGLLDTANFRRTLAGICLIIQPFINLISVAISPQQSTDTSEQLAMIGAYPTRFLIANLLDLLWLLLLIPAVLGLLHLLRSGGALLGHIGCGFVLAGAVGAAAYRGVNLGQLQVAESALKQGQVLTAFGQPSLGSSLVMLISAIGLVIGYALLAGGCGERELLRVGHRPSSWLFWWSTSLVLPPVATRSYFWLLTRSCWWGWVGSE